MLIENQLWFALQVAPQKEKVITCSLSNKGYECFLPLYTKQNLWSDRVKVITAPLFPGYVFCRFDSQRRLPVLTTPGVHQVVGCGKCPIPIPEEELAPIRLALNNGLFVEPYDQLQEGDRVRVIRGPLTGLEAIFVRHRSGYRVVVSLNLIQRSVAVEMDRVSVEPCARPFSGSGRVDLSRTCGAPRC